MNNPKVTIVTVTYNCKDLLEETILSVINQTYENIEYIIIDGASTDGTLDIIKKYEKHISYWISEPDNGIYYAMNKGIEKATGEWINFMNAGDSFVNNETIFNTINSLDNNTDIIYGEHVSNGKVCSVEHRKDILRIMPCCHQSVFAKTNLMKKTLFDITYSIVADYDFILKMYQDGKKIKYIKEPICNYLEGGVSEQDVVKREFETIAIYINNGIDENKILNSHVYNNIIKESTIVKNQKSHLMKLKTEINELISISFFSHPIKKIKKYKQFIKIYRSLKI